MEALEKVQKVATSTTPVLLIGESGTGKEFFAHLIHNLSPRKNSLFVTVNFEGVPKGLQERELFGSELGTVAGKIMREIGKLEIADKGTVFFDRA